MEEKKKIWIRRVDEKKPAFEVNEDVGEKFLAKSKIGKPVYKQVSAPPTPKNLAKVESELALTAEKLAEANARIAALEGKQAEKPVKVEK